MFVEAEIDLRNVEMLSVAILQSIRTACEV
jgi:hypothetical protein